jgi:hypothetical protein
VHFGVKDVLNLHAYTNYCLGFIEPFILILLCNAINIALFCCSCKNQINLAIFKFCQVWCFCIPFNWWIGVSLKVTQIWVGKLNQSFHIICLWWCCMQGYVVRLRGYKFWHICQFLQLWYVANFGFKFGHVFLSSVLSFVNGFTYLYIMHGC